MARLLLVRHAPTVATARGAFPADEPLSSDAAAQAKALARPWPADCTAATSPALRCRQTAAALDLAAVITPSLAECDFGTWAGCTFAEAQARDPDGVSAWLTDPGARPHGGESLVALRDRVAKWLDSLLADPRPHVAVTHEGVIRAALVIARRLELDAFWAIRAAPLSVTVLHRYGSGWNAPTAADAATSRR